MTFLPKTLDELRNKLATLEEEREIHRGDLEHYANLVAKYQTQYDVATAAVEDYSRLLKFAEGMASDDERMTREYEAHEANEAWLDEHPDDYDPVDDDSESESDR